MNSLHSLIDLKPGKKDMICIIGAGGKTSVLFQLAEELSSMGFKVLVTTTTAIYHPESGQYDRILVGPEEAAMLFDSCDTKGITVYGRAVSTDRKLLGASPELLDDVHRKGNFDYIIVEGDGSKGRPVKAPASHEPVIPSLTGKLLGVIGLDCIGSEVTEGAVHRPELFSRITGSGEGSLISAESLVRLVLHEEGLFKAAPAAADRYLVLNKADSDKEINNAREIIKSLGDKEAGLSGIIVSSFREASFRKAGGISGIILAAGASKRMGSNKLLLPFGGVPVIERVVKAASESALSEVILVYGNDMVRAIGDRYKAKTVGNEQPQLGQSVSVRLGVESASEYSDGFMFLVGDQPFITAETINKLIESYTSGNYSAVVPMYNGKRGNPVIFSSTLREELMNLEGDSGGRTLLGKLPGKIAAVNMDDERGGLDIDTREEYEMLLKLEE